ncbi:hypothetical protein L2E82_24472 [Cichorium intybus]|uniref:Uncharacterized protein n=1 Tax=Cichorium intybus TaxID=13427 RepID=A0ACB9E180_CICIN|nr:hypothetical protein L2E82_24472 [Cichorium intybus]
MHISYENSLRPSDSFSLSGPIVAMGANDGTGAGCGMVLRPHHGLDKGDDEAVVQSNFHGVGSARGPTAGGWGRRKVMPFNIPDDGFVL